VAARQPALLRARLVLPRVPQAASGSAAFGDSSSSKPEPESSKVPEPVGDAMKSVDLVYPEGFEKRRMVVFVGILVAYTCL